jgi:hypothetical protein
LSSVHLWQSIAMPSPVSGSPRRWLRAEGAAVFLLATLAYAASPAIQVLPIVWIAHIGFDRLLGYGLKYRSDFKDTISAGCSAVARTGYDRRMSPRSSAS